jgi:choline monooxygenase
MSTSLAEKLAAFDPSCPLERARTIPSYWYHDADIYAAECRHVFSGCWQTVGRVDQVSRPGSFLTAEVAGEPIVVVRDGEGVLRAFYNVCRHRAALVVNEAEGQTTRLRCRYHGWTYDLTGRLRGTPEFDGVADFCKEDNGLVQVAVDTWGPLVFIHQAAVPVDRALEQFLNPLPRRTEGLGLEQLGFVARREYEVACNWKVYVDNYLDGGYHVNTVHPGLAGALDYSRYRTEIEGNTSVQIAPLKPSADPAVGKVRTGENAYYRWVFPNLMINLYQDVMDTNLVLPLGPECCKVIFDFYFAPRQGEEAERFMAQSIAVADQVQAEDMGICEEVQRGLRSRAFDTGRFSVKREAGGLHFHRLLAEALRPAKGEGEHGR